MSFLQRRATRELPSVVCSSVLWLRFVKLLAVMALVAGTVGTVFPAISVQSRRRFAYGLVGPAFGATWGAGILLTFAREHSLLAPWIVGALLATFISLNGVLYAAGRGRTSWVVAAVALVPLVVTLALMVWRPG